MAMRNFSVSLYMPEDFRESQCRYPASFTYSEFHRKYSEALQRYPFQEEYIGKTNPLTNHVIKNLEDYRLFLRETVFMNMTADMEARMRHSFVLERQAKESQARAEAQVKEAYLDVTAAKNSMQAAERRMEEMQRGRDKVLSCLLAAIILLSLVAFFVGRSRGKADGFAEGYAAGEQVGLSDGFERSLSQGVDSGEDEGYEKGYDAGKTDGYRDGYSDGVDDGYNTGYDSGYSDGLSAQTPNRSSSSGWYSGYSANSGSTRDDPIANTYIGNKSSKKFHLPTCSYLPNQSNQVTFHSREEALSAGYDPCGHCHP